MKRDRDLATLIAMTDGTLPETRERLAGSDRLQAAQITLQEIAYRTRLFDGPATPVHVQFELTGGPTLTFVITVGPADATVAQGHREDAVVVIRQDLAELLRSVYGTAALPHDATRVVSIMNEPGPETDALDDPWVIALRAATLGAGQVVSACSPYDYELGSLARRFGSDKWGDHFYTPRYEQHLARYRDQRITLLEIGVGGYESPTAGGESLRMWKAYFRRGLIYGVDVFDKSAIDEPRLRTIRGDQSDAAFLESVAAAAGPIDIIIDDGSHVSDHVLASFRTLFPRLVDGGLYVIEDLHTSYWPGWNGQRSDVNDPATTVGFIKTLVDGVHRRDHLPGAIAGSEEIADNISAVHLYRNIVFIEKGVNGELAAPSWVRRHSHDMQLTPRGSMRRMPTSG